MRNLKSLKILDVRFCKLIKSLPSLNELVCLQSLYMSGCENLTQLPNMYKLTNLQNLELNQNGPLQSFTGLSDLISLRSLHLRMNEVQDGPNLCKLTMLKRLYIAGWQGQGFSSLVKLVLLESVFVCNCKGIRVMPDLQRLLRLGELDLRRCEFEDMSGLSHLTNLQTLEIKDCDKLEVLPDLQELAKLKELTIKRCARLRDVRGILGMWNLKRLQLSGDPWLHENLGPDLLRPMIPPILLASGSGIVDQQGPVAYSQLGILTCIKCPIQELPDLANFPELFYLKVVDCVNFTKLTCTGPLSPTFRHLNIQGCMRLQALPDLTNSQEMQFLNVANTGLVLSTQLIQDMKARWPSIDLITE